LIFKHAISTVVTQRSGHFAAPHVAAAGAGATFSASAGSAPTAAPDAAPVSE
jgi:hypothetical protein